MWAPLLLFFIVGLTSAEYGWKAGTQYNYEIRGRTLTGLFQAANQYSGMNIRAKLLVQAQPNSILSLQVHGAEFAEIHSNLTSGWTSEIPDGDLHYTSLPIRNDPFEVTLHNGVVKGMVVDKNLPVWELNMLKSIVSLLQVDTQGENLKKSKLNLLPGDDDVTGVYKTMEDSIHGKYETTYDVSELPEYVIQSRPEMVPLPHLRGNGKFINIVKTRNFSNSDQHMVYSHGMSGTGNWEPASNQMGNMLTRFSGCRIVASGSMQRYVIQSSVTDEKIIVAPHMFNKQKGIVATRLNLTLEGVVSVQGPAPKVSNPLKIDNLVYQYQAQSKRSQNSSENSKRNEGSDSLSSSSSSSSESYENTSREDNKLRKNASVLKKSDDATMDKYRSSESSSSSSRSSSSSSESSSSSSSRSSSSSESSESLSSSEEYYQSSADMSGPSQASFLVFYVGYKGQSIHQAKDFNGAEQAIKLSREIGFETQNPDSMTGASTLSKFTILTNLLRTMSVEQLKQISDKLFISQSHAEKSPEGSKDYQAWISFRDAVAQAGTNSPLLIIKDWIKSNKVQGEEAAQLIAILQDSARLPTKEYMETFFEIVKDSQVEGQMFLNTSAILSFTDLVRKAMVDGKDMHKRYPVHMFGPTNGNDDALESYIQYFDGKLKKSVEEGDSIKIQVYISALGNIAHRRILASYEPYLEGKKQISNFQRLVMIASMNRMTKVYPEESRAVLYRIYQNSAESPEIRTAAVMQIMKTNPPAQMLQRMAQRTNSDHSRQVNAAVKSAIESAARQPINRYNRQLTENARSAEDLLTSENFGAHNSRNYIRSFIVKDQNIGYKHHFSYIQSRDSMLPKSVFYILKRNLGTYKRDSHEVQFMTSSVDQLLEQLSEQVNKPPSWEQNKKQQKRNSGSEWSLEDIYQLLNFEEQSQEPLEGNFLISAFGGQRYFHFDNHTIEKMPQIAQQMRTSLENGRSFNFTKFYNQYSYDVAFSTAMGLPFVYSMTVPTVVSFNGQVKASLRSQQFNEKKAKLINVPDILTLDGAYDIMYSTQRQGKMSIVAPFISKVYTAVLEKNIQVRIPLSSSFGIDLKTKRVDTRLEPLEKDKQHKVFEYSSDAYTSSHDVLDMQPLKNNKNTQKLNIGKLQELKKTVGQHTTGFAFDINMKGEGKPLDMAKMYERFNNHDLVSFILFGDMDGKLDNSNITIVYNPERSTAEKMKMSFQYSGQKAQQSVHGESLNKHKLGSNLREEENLSLPKTAGREERQQELLKNAVAGIKDAEGHIIDMALIFDGKERREYAMNVAYASSPVSNNSRILAYLKNTTSSQTSKTFQAGLHIDMKSPKVSITNFKEAMNADPTTEMRARLDFGEKTPLESYLILEGEMKASPERKEYLRHHPLSVLCEKQMQDGLYIQPACRNVTARANYLDNYRFTVTYKNLSGKLQNFSRMVYRAANDYWYPNNKENFFNLNNKDGEILMNVNFGKGLRKVNVSLTTPDLYSKFEEVEVHEWLRPAFVMHPSYGMMERLSQKIFYSQQYPVCALDGNYITTFDNSSYQVKLGNRPHVLAQSIFTYGGLRKLNSIDEQNDYFSIIARQQSDHQLEMYVLAGDNVFEIEPTGEKSANFKFNEENVSVKEGSKIPLSDKSGKEVMQVMYVQGAYKIVSKNFGFELVWSRKSARLQVNNGFRGKVRGLCGNFDGEMYNDFITPRGMIVNSTEAFAASYAVPSGSAEEITSTSGQQEFAGYREEIILGNVISEKDKGMDKKSKLIKKDSLKIQDSKQTHENLMSRYRVQVVQEPGKTCFSVKPQLSCGASAKASRLVEKTIDFHCIGNSNASKHWERIVKLGATPDFTQKGSNHRATLKVPEQCISV